MTVSPEQAAWYLTLLNPEGWFLDTSEAQLWVAHRDVPDVRMLYETYRDTWLTVPTARMLWNNATDLHASRHLYLRVRP